MMAFLHWLSMSGYAAYVWAAYGIVVMVLSAIAMNVRRQRKHIWKKLTQIRTTSL